MKRTPGEWSAVEVGHYGAGDNIMPLFEVHSGECAVVCENLKETDARLIAAAPAMLEALELAYKTLDAICDRMTVGDRWTNEGQDLLDSLDPVAAAIKAAKGEA